MAQNSSKEVFGEAVSKVLAFLIRAFLIFPLKVVAPISVIHVAYKLWCLLRSKKGINITLLLKRIAEGWLATEFFFLIYYKYASNKLQKRIYRKIPKVDINTVKRCFDAISIYEGANYSELEIVGSDHNRDKISCTELVNLESYLRSTADQHKAPDDILIFDNDEILALKRGYVRGWFLGAELEDIKRENAVEWIAWAFFHSEMDELKGIKHAEEQVENIVQLIEDWAKIKLDSGYNSNTTCMRLNLDPVISSHRPLLYYLVTSGVFSVLLKAVLNYEGFTKHKSGSLAYWHYKPTIALDTGSKNYPPIVFCHGLGVGVLPYINFILELMKHNPGREIFLIQLPNISMTIKEDVHGSTELVSCIELMLHTWGFDSAHFVGHSFGSVVMAYVCKKRKEIMAAATFLDPVCFLLCKPDVSYNFIYREAEKPTHLLLKYFVAEELYTAHSLSRYFHWDECILWPEDLEGIPTVVGVSANDSVVPSHSVYRYLTAYKTKNKECQIRPMFFKNLGHTECMWPHNYRIRKDIFKEMEGLDVEFLSATKSKAEELNQYQCI
uniref:AB hydrolase-1 domain-containing protein n=1 Tax=Aplanochytrium stocchinoi TaxID=215587 RepID=A0A7S3PQ22_9STRA|mmetsp:Transcript_35629/g.44148  ORF Transcript_35629/g.44148 Transcript_35629/m.44148 type:complete len:554 (+) Transcript_35629:217-1878(+)